MLFTKLAPVISLTRPSLLPLAHSRAGSGRTTWIPRRLLIVALALIGAAYMPAAPAQSFPSKSITLIWPFPGGGTVEQSFRAVAAEASKILGQSVLVESRPGASGMLGINAVKQSRGDPHVLSIAHNGMLVSVPLSSAIYNIEPGRDYTPVVLVLKTNLILMAHPSVTFRDVPGLVAYAKSNPGKLDAAVVGTASNSHLALELLKSSAGIQITNIPYKGESQALPDLLAGTVKMMFLTSTAKQHIDAGKMVGIATTGPDRWGLFPDLPTMRETGLHDYSVVGWFGIVAPPGTSADVVAKLNNAFNAAIKVASVRKVILDFGVEPLGSTAEEMNALIKTDLERWAPIMRSAGIKIE